MKPKIVLFDIDYTLFDTDLFRKSGLKKHSVYSEVNDVLTVLSKVATLGIFSEGDIEFQKNKLLKTGVKKHFLKEFIHIAEKKEEVLKKILKKYKNNKIFLVDDKLSILHLAKNISSSIFTIWVKRGIYAENQKKIPGFKPDSEVGNLKETLQLVISY
ncbi:MAG: hypothetical protein HYT08_01115 [Candidatus Levybacteria bacterium]|nr:hypothetical protein [Candidatus Levybacteria bacterium]